MARLGLQGSLWRWLWQCLCLVMLVNVGRQSTLAAQTAAPELSTSFTAADGMRSYMDAGGVWSGSGEVTMTTGDTFALTIFNDGLGTAHDLSVVIELPAEFRYVANSLTGLLGASASQAMDTLTISLPSATTIDPAGTISLNFGLTTEVGVTEGTKLLTHDFYWADSPSGSQKTVRLEQSINVLLGERSLDITPRNQERAIGATATWDVSVRNTGFGGLFDVMLDESALAASSSLMMTGMTQTVPATPLASGSSPVLTLPYLAPGETFVVQVTALVVDCAGIQNEITSNDRVGPSSTLTDEVVLDLTVPMLTLATPSVPLNYGVPVSVTVGVQNTGVGEARNVTFAADFDGEGMTVSNVTGGWSYTAGTFTYNANSGTILGGGAADISFQVEQTDPCGGDVDNVVWFSSYSNACAQVYSTPTEQQTVVKPADAPSLTLSIASPERGVVAQPAKWTLALSASNTQNIATDPLVVTDVLPAGISAVSIGAAPSGTTVSCSGSCGAGDTVTWTVPLAALSGGDLELEIDYTAPTDPCLGGMFFGNSASVTAIDSASCTLSQTATSQVLLSNNSSSAIVQSFNVATAPDDFYETGTADLNSNATRDAGEGEFVPLESTFGFPAGTAGTWAGSTYEDDFGGAASQALVANTVFVSVNSGSAVPVPSGSITVGTGMGFADPGITIDLTFLSGLGFSGSTTVAGHSFTLTYMTTVGDDALPNTTHSLVQLSTLKLAGGNSGCTSNGSEFTLGEFVPIGRAAAAVAVAMPAEVDVCETFLVTLRVRNANAKQASHIRLTLDTTGDYGYVTGQTPIYGGVFTASNIVYSENAGMNPTFTLTPAETELSAEGTVTVMVRREAQSGVALTGITATVAYDDNETALIGGRAFQGSGTDEPSVVGLANLQGTVSPSGIDVIGGQATWVTYGLNGGDGETYETVLRCTVPSGLTPNKAAMDTANGTLPAVVVAGQLMTWDLGSFSGDPVAVTVICDVAGTTCSINPGSINTVWEWGCGGILEQTIALTEPDVRFPGGVVRVLHDTSNSQAVLCGTGQIEIVASNVGLTYLQDLVVNEALAPLVTGVDIVPGTVEFKRNTDSTWTAASNPTGSGAPYVFSDTEIPPLSELAPSSVSGGVHTVRIRFDVTANELANTSSRSIDLSASAMTICGSSATATGETYSLPLEEPRINVAVSGRNVTRGQSTHTATVYGTVGDQVEWMVDITNSAMTTAENVRLTSNLAATGASNFTISGPNHNPASMVSDGGTIDVPDVAGVVRRYLVTETLGATCVDDVFTASATWGCVSNGIAAASNLSSPGASTGTANLRMIPSFADGGTDLEFFPLPGGRVQASITLTNQGGLAQSIVVTNSLPAGFEIDSSYTQLPPSGASSITGVVVGGTAVAPTFALAGNLRNAATTTFVFEILPVSNFDPGGLPFTNPETSGSGGDPIPPATAPSNVVVDHESGCSTVHQDSYAEEMNAATPDVDVVVSPSSLVVADGLVYSFDYTITNNGDAGSFANAAEFTTSLGAGWTASSVEVVSVPSGAGGSVGPCPGGVCPPTTAVVGNGALGILAAGESAVVRVTATANDTGALTMSGQLEADLLRSDGSDTGDNYSLDIAQSQVIGFECSLTLIGTTEPETTGNNVAIGEDQSWRLRGRFFGGVSMGNILMRNTLPAGLGYVTHAVTGNHDVTIQSTTLGGQPVTGATAVSSGVLDFGVANTSNGTFEVDVVARALNIPGNTQDLVLTNNLGVSLLADYGSGVTATFASDNSADGFGGSESSLHAEDSVTVKLPVATLVTVVRNVTTTGAFGELVQAQGEDVVEYRTTITNDGNAPLFDVRVADNPVAPTLLVVDGAADSVDNDGDTLVDTSDPLGEGSFVAGGGGSAIFEDANTQLALGSSLARLDPGETVTLLYRATLDPSVVPDQQLLDAVSLSASSLSGANGGQASSLGSPGTASGERQFAGTDSATTEVVMIMLAKTIDDTSIVDSTGGDVFIGEQVRFELSVVLPAGQVPALVVEDELPEELLLLATPAVAIGSSISGAAVQPTISPNSLPANGAPLTVQWAFGTRTVAAGSAANRTITIQYLAQVRNVPINVGAGVSPTQITNSASYSFTGSTSNSSTVVLDVREAEFSIVQTPSPGVAVDAGQVITYTVVATNTGSYPGYDINYRTQLPTGMTYVPNSTTSVSGAALGEPDVGLQVVWGRGQASPLDIDLAMGQSMQWTYQVLIGNGVEPDQVLENNLLIDWTSLDGDPGANLGTTVGAAGSASGERTGSTLAVNQNVEESTQSTTITNLFSTDSSAASGDTVATGGFRVGDLVTLTTAVTLQEGTVDAFRLQDTLPTGLSFFDVQSILPASGAQGFAYTAPTGASAPAAGQTGLLTWNLGTVVNAGDNLGGNDTLTLVYRARIEDDAAFGVTPTTQSVQTLAQSLYLDSAGNAEVTGTQAATVVVKQPQLGVVSALRTPATTGADETVGYRLTISNSGAATAFNTQVVDALPAGMRLATPSLVAATLDGVPIAIGAPAYSSATGALSWSLSDAVGIAPGQVLVVDYNATVDTSVGAGVTLANAPGIAAYFSKPSTDGTERRQYVASSAAAQSTTTPLPTDMAKARDLASLAVGEVVTFTLTAPATAVDATLYDVRILDSVDARLRVTSVSDNATALGTSTASLTAGNAVDVSFAAIPPNTQAILTVQAVVEDQLGTTTATSITNQSSFTWAQVASGTAQASIASNSVALTVEEAELGIAKVFKSQTLANPLQGLQAGDSVTYTVTVTNSGDGEAFDFVIRDIGDDDLINPVVTANPDNPGGATSAGPSGGNRVHTWSTIAGPIASGGGTYVFDVTFTIANTVQPFQNLDNNAEVDWFSTPGPNPDRRGPASGYSSVTPTAVTVTAGSVSMTKVDLGGGNYTVGDEYTYRLITAIVQGQVTDLHLLDDLPVGLELRSTTLTSSDLQLQGGGAVAIVSGPTVGATGTLDWDLGDLASTGPSPTVQLDLLVRVLDVPTNTTAETLTNSARSTIEFPVGSGSMATINAQADPQITIVEPELVLALDAPADVVLGTAADVQARLRNDGTANAWQPVLVVELPSEMRAKDPTTLPLTATIMDGRTVALAVGVDYTVAWDGNTGRLTLALQSAAGFVAPGETLVVDLQAELDFDATDALAQDYVATVTTYGGQDSSSGPPALSRSYPTLFGSGTLNTPNALSGDDPSDGASSLSSVPVLTMTKAVDATAADPGTLLHYTLVLSNTGTADGEDAVLRDELAAAFQPGTLTNVSTAPAGGVNASDPNGGANSSGVVLLTDLTVPAGGSVTIEYDVALKPVLPNGSVVGNQASLSLPVFPEPVLSDSVRPEDDDGIEAGNDPADPNDDDPCNVTIGSMPVFELDKTVVDINGGSVEVGDQLEWTLTLTNSGNESAEQVVLTDSIPANTSYVAGSTNQNGQTVNDVAGQSPLAAGMSIASPGAPSGTVLVSDPVTVTFRVLVGSSAANGTLIANQASVDGRGEGVGTPASAVSDDPGTQTAGDPTVIIVGSGPALRVSKQAMDGNGAPLLPGDEVAYRITLENVGNEPLSQVVIRDPIVSQAAYLAASMRYDPDGSGPATALSLTDLLDGDIGDFGITASDAVTVNVGTLAAGGSAVLEFDVVLSGTAAIGSVLTNQAIADSLELPSQRSDSDGNDGNGQQSTDLVVGNVAALSATKMLEDMNGGALEAGDQVRFTIRVANTGTQDATNVVLTDLLPLTVSSYVAGSTTVDGVAVADAGSDSPLLTGLALGTLLAGAEAAVTVRIVVDPQTLEGTTVRNEASYTADGPLSGTSNAVEVVVGGSPGSATLRGSTWLDLNHDRVRDGSEPAEAGWIVELLRNESLVATTASDANGNYELAGVLPGAGYELRFRHPQTLTIYGGAISSAVGVTTAFGTIQNLTLPNGSLTVDQSLPIDPSGVIYNSVTRELLEGVTVTLSGPAGFDPLIHLLPGQAVQTTDASGFYRFDLTAAAPAGVYTIEPVPPAGFLPTVPSQIAPPLPGPLDPTGLPDPVLVAPQNGPPSVGAASTNGTPGTALPLGNANDYYLSFDLAAGDPNVVNNHIALDPVLEGAIALSKTSPKTDVVRGELVPYEITMRNTVAALLPGIELVDVIPPGFQYVTGSAAIDDLPVAPVAQGRTLTWPALALQSMQERRVRLLLVVTSGADVGRYINRAHVLEPTSATVVSNVATATVRVVPDPLFDGSDVIGKVFDDANANGVQDPGEPGIAGARLITARGLVVLTDEFGRYHITDPLVVSRSRGANFIIKLDVRSLPTGYRMTTENPRVVRLTRGKISKANFGIARMRVVRVELSGGAFAQPGGLKPTTAVKMRLELIVRRLEETPSLLRLAYVQIDEKRALVDKRLQAVSASIERAWQSRSDRPPLSIEQEVVRVSVLDEERPGAPLGEIAGGVRGLAGRVDVLPFAAIDDDVDRSGVAGSGVSLRMRRPILPVPPTLGIKVSGESAERLVFQANSSFPGLVASAEVVVVHAVTADLVVRIPLDDRWRASWLLPEERGVDDWLYSVRVMLADGRKVESTSGSLRRDADGRVHIGAAAPTILRLPKTGATTTLFVDGVGAAGHRIWIDGVPAEVSAAGKFSRGFILPEGRHEIRVSMQGPHGERRTVAQTVRVAQSYRIEPSDTGNIVRGSQVRVMGVPSNTERGYTGGRRIVPPFRVSVDGELASTEELAGANAGRTTDLALADANIRVSFDGLKHERRLNVSTWPDVAVRGEPIVFDSYSNYGSWIAQAEIRIHARDTDAAKTPLVVLPLNEDGRASWLATPGFGDRVDYVLRVYDRDGNFDETRPKALHVVAKRRPLDTKAEEQLLRDRLYGTSDLRHQGIELKGGTVQVHGASVPKGYRVLVGGQPVPVDSNGRFVTNRILSPGNHSVRIDLVDTGGRTIRFERPIVIPDSDWFYVAMADLTMATHDTDGPGADFLAETAGREDVYLDGRVALYVKGKIKGNWLLTAMLDTGEEGVEDLLRNIDDKDPRQLLRRLDPDRYYYVYGDDSTTQWDAATMGKFYVRIERGPTHVLWGNFRTGILDTELGQLDRALYGAKLHWETASKSERGKPRVQIDGYAAEPETIQSREEFRGTGGSLYYLRNQDLTIGSERLRVEVRDRDSGLVLETRELRPFEDYDLNYIQGRILLSDPLPTVAGDGYTVRNTSLAGQPVYLVARYEYRPALGTLDNLSVGGRISTALGDSVELGVTAGRDEQVGVDQELLAADVLVRASDRTWVKFEAAQTDGPGLGEQFSVDGGFAFGNVPRDASPSGPARALRVETAFDLRDAFGEDWLIDGTAYYEQRERGFSAPGRQTLADTYQWGVRMGAQLTSTTRLDVKWDRRRMDFGANTDAGHVDIRQKLGEHWTVQGGLAFEDNQNDVGSALSFQQGKRLDAALQVEYDSREDWKLYVFGQATVDRDATRQDMSRGGVGGSVRLNDRVTVGGEVSGGATGLGAKADLKWKVDERTDTYLSYGLGTDSTAIGIGQRAGTLTSGAKHRYSDAISLYGEERYRHGDGPEGLTHAYGVDFTPDDRWTVGASVEDGELIDPLGGSIERTSISLTGGYRNGDVRYGGAVELRDESFGGARRETWLVRNNLAVKLSEDWRGIAKGNFSVSNGAGGQFFDGDFVEASTGLAYRPVDNDRWNWLLTYTYLADLPSPGQVTRAGGTFDLEQRSHVFAYDVTWDACDWMSVGGKYALRHGELRTSRTGQGQWFDSTTQLAILRLDWHAVSEWDVHVEGRWRDVDIAQDERLGALFGVYRHMSQNVRFGLGYNFTDFSDRITDLRYDSNGFFVNLTAKF